MSYEIRITDEALIKEEFSYYADKMGSKYEVGRVWGVDKYGNPTILDEIHVEIVMKEQKEDKTT